MNYLKIRGGLIRILNLCLSGGEVRRCSDSGGLTQILISRSQDNLQAEKEKIVLKLKMLFPRYREKPVTVCEKTLHPHF